jgi:hypothetical protein
MPPNKFYTNDLEGRTQAVRDAMDDKYGRRDETHLHPYHISDAEQARIDQATEYAQMARDEKVVR